VILDLWLIDSTGLSNIAWNGKGDASAAGDYPTNMYGASKIRAFELNNGGKYWANSTDTTLTTYTAVSTSTYGIYTMPYSTSYTSSIRKYIVQPKNISYQSNENSYGIVLSELKTDTIVH
ncbi:MAG: hypothetical protein K2K24_03025, partial [Clostridia bacterium]|nr:hypothetical protein [Clostridia bacterium]